MAHRRKFSVDLEQIEQQEELTNLRTPSILTSTRSKRFRRQFSEQNGGKSTFCRS